MASVILTSLDAAELQRKEVADLIAEKNELKEEVRRLNATTANLEDALRLLQKHVLEQDRKLASMLSTQQRLKEDLAESRVNAAANYASQDQAAALEKGLKALSADWASDKKELTRAMSVVETKLGEIQRITEKAISLASSRPTPVREPTPSKPKNQPSGEFKGVEHQIEDGQYLWSIMTEFNKAIKARGMKGNISVQDILDANPGLDANRMPVGKGIRLPFPD